jgi:hypothetical protein
LTLGWTGTLADARITSAATWHAKQAALNGTGLVRMTGTTVSYDNTAYYPASNPNGYTSNAGTTTGTGADGQVAFWSGTSTQTGDGGFTWNNTFKILTINSDNQGVIISGVTPTLRIEDTTNSGSLIDIGAISGGVNISNIAFYTRNGGSPVEVMRINNIGNVGIGTTTPAYNLEVVGSIKSTLSYESDGVVTMRTIPTGGNGYFGTTSNHPLLFQVNSDEKMRILSNGNVGIGTTSPANKLTISNDGAAGYSTSIGLYNTFNTAANRNWAIGLNRNAYGDFSIITSSVQDGVPNTERLYISNSGNVGIGTTSPAEKLHVIGNVLFQNSTPAWAAADSSTGLVISGSDSGGTNYISNYYDTSIIQIGAGVTQKTGIIINGQASTLGSTIQFRTGGSEKVRIAADGNVGIGTTSPSGALEIKHNGGTIAGLVLNSVATDSGRIRFQNNAVNQWDLGTTSTSFFLTNQVASRTDITVLASNGNVGIGTTTLPEKLTINGYAQATGYKIPSGTALQYLMADGSVSTGGGNFVTLDTEQSITAKKTWDVAIGSAIEITNTTGYNSIIVQVSSGVGSGMKIINSSTSVVGKALSLVGTAATAGDLLNIGVHSSMPSGFAIRVDDISSSPVAIFSVSKTGNVQAVTYNGVRKYVALLNQTGTSAPVATVLENSLGFVPTYGYTTAGFFTINSSSGWIASKTAVLIENNTGTNMGTSVESTSSIGMTTRDDTGTLVNNALVGQVIEIRIYS